MQSKQSHGYDIRKFKKILLMLILMWIFLPGYSQNSQTIRGTVVNEKDETVIGASVVVAGTTRGILTDVDGKFSIEAKLTDELVISFIGYQTQKVKVGNNTELRIVIKERNLGLDEVVVVAYGSQKKISLTGAISSLKGEDLTITKNENVVNMMTGKIPGVRVHQIGGEPGSFETKFDIRGMGNALVVIDGVPSSEREMQRLNANDIESMSVLKDASAAVYGLRAANGVVLIKTKKGSSSTPGKFDIGYSYNQGWQFFPNVPEACDVFGFMELNNEKVRRDFNGNYFTPRPVPYTEQDMELYRNGTLSEINWSDLVMRDYAPQSQHNVNLNGSSKNIDYYFNVGYMQQEGNFKSNAVNYDRWNFRSNVDFKITDRLKGEVKVSGYTETKNLTEKDVWVVYKNIWMQMPTQQAYANNNPLYPSTTPDNENPVVITNPDLVGGKQRKYNSFQGQLGLSYDIPGVKGLIAKGMYNYNYKVGDERAVKKEYTLYQYDREKDIYNSILVNGPSTISRYYDPSKSTLMQLSLNYENIFNKVHHITGLGLYEEATDEWENVYARRNLALPSVEELFAGKDIEQIGSSNGRGQSASKSWIGKFNYDYSGKYLAEFSFRYDGSSKFKKEKQWGFFPAGSLGWRISEESFFKNVVTLSFVNDLKLRGSYGVMGDDSATAYQYIGGYNYPDPDRKGYMFDQNFIYGLKSRGIVNPNLTWYTAKTLDIGVDIGLWNQLLSASADYFIRNRSGLLATRLTTIPGTVGTNLPQENLDSDRTSGFEIILTHYNQIQDFQYNVSVNASTSRSMDRYVERTPSGNSYENWKDNNTNRNKNIWWGKESEGQFQNYDQIVNHPIKTGVAVPGDYYYKDWNNDGVIDEKDERPIAVRDMPLVNYGISIGAAWRNFDFSLLFQGASSFYVEFDGFYAAPAMWDRNSLTKFFDRWHTENPDDNMFDPNTKWISGYHVTTGSPLPEGTQAVQDASYIRLKTLELGYTIPKNILAKVGVKDLRVYANGYNLLTFTSLRDADPEHPGKQPEGQPWYGGGSNYPINGSFNIGAKITF